MDLGASSVVTHDPEGAAARVKALALEAGFDECRIAPAVEAPHADAFRQWLADGCHAGMAWMAAHPDRRADPRVVLDGCRSVVMLAMNYFTGPPPPSQGRFARYAWNDDYHEVIAPRLKAMAASMETLGGRQRCYVDTGPLLERDFAHLAGLGWSGKSTVQIHRRLGTWFFLAGILTTLDLTPDAAARDHCGKCTACLAACPTGALTGPHRLDARLCISYLTIEHKGDIPDALRPLIGNRVYGCDDCLDACPWNRFAQVSREAAFHAREAALTMPLRDFLALDDDAFRALFRRSPVKRIKRPRFLRNVCVVLGNTGTAGDIPSLNRAMDDPDPLIAGHAAWAVAQINGRLGKITANPR